MPDTRPLTRILAIIGSALTWFPLLAPFLLGAMVSLRARQFHFDYLMPAELFPVSLAGGALLLWAALRARSYWKLIASGLGLAVLLLFAGQALAVATGLASGETEPSGLPWVLVVASLVLYIIALFVTGLGGLLLLRTLFRPSTPPLIP